MSRKYRGSVIEVPWKCHGNVVEVSRNVMDLQALAAGSVARLKRARELAAQREPALLGIT